MVIVLALIAAAVTHYVYGGLQLQSRGERTTTAARVHLSLLLAALVLVRAASYWLDRYSLTTKDSRLITGLTYTDAHAVMPTKAILAVAALMCAVLFVATIWTQSWRLPALGVGLLVVCAIAVGGIYPARRAELQGEAVREVARGAVHRPQHPGDPRGVRPGQRGHDPVQGEHDRDAAVSCATTPTRSPASGWSTPRWSRRRSSSCRRSSRYYQFPDVLDVDRYTIDGKLRDTVIAARELDLNGLPAGQRNWVNDHTVYTHGFGVVAAYGNQRGDDGQPVFYQQNIPLGGPARRRSSRGSTSASPRRTTPSSAAPRAARSRSSTSRDSSATGQQNTTYTGQGGVRHRRLRPPGGLRDQVPRAELPALRRRQRRLAAARPPHPARAGRSGSRRG